MQRLVGWCIAIGSLATVLSSCDWAGSAYYDITSRITSTPLERLRISSLSSQERLLLQRVERIEKFAVDHLSLRPPLSFDEYLHTTRDYLTDVVSAVGEFSFSTKAWGGPIGGRSKQREFFQRSDAEEVAVTLKREGWDVLIRESDVRLARGGEPVPILSFLSLYNEAELAEFVLYRIAIETVTTREVGPAMEGFARIVAERGTELYLIEHFGEGTHQLDAYQRELFDRARYRRDILRLRERLRVLYDYIARRHPEIEKGNGGQRELIDTLRQQKAEIIASFQRGFALHYADMYRTDRYAFSASYSINNAYIARFDPADRKEAFARVCDEVYGGDVARMVMAVRDATVEGRNGSGDRRGPLYTLLTSALQKR